MLRGGSGRSQTLLLIALGNQPSSLYLFKNYNNFEQFTSLQDLLSSSARWKHGLERGSLRFLSRLTFPGTNSALLYHSSLLLSESLTAAVASSPLKRNLSKCWGPGFFHKHHSDKEHNARAYCSHQYPSNFINMDLQ